MTHPHTHTQEHPYERTDTRSSFNRRSQLTRRATLAVKLHLMGSLMNEEAPCLKHFISFRSFERNFFAKSWRSQQAEIFQRWYLAFQVRASKVFSTLWQNRSIFTWPGQEAWRQGFVGFKVEMKISADIYVVTICAWYCPCHFHGICQLSFANSYQHEQ